MRQFASRVEVEAYLDAQRIECLECGRRFEFLPPHLNRAHGIDAAEYRSRHALPAMTPLAGSAYRLAHTEHMRQLRAAGRITNELLARATAAAAQAGRPPKQAADAAAHRDRLHAVQPWAVKQLPAGAKRLDGRSADRAREYQRARRALLSGIPEPMAEYRAKRRER